jgi:hypothetical protein
MSDRKVWYVIYDVLSGEVLHVSDELPPQKIEFPHHMRALGFYPDPLRYRWDSDVCRFVLRDRAPSESAVQGYFDDDSHGI